MNELFVGYEGGQYRLVDVQGQLVQVLAPGDVFDLFTGSHWQRASIQSGGYKGWYIITSESERRRLGIGARVRLPERQPSASALA